MKKILVVYMLISLCVLSPYAQTNALIEQMQKERAAIEQQISESEKLLAGTEGDIATQVANLNTISALLKERKKLLEQTKKDIRSLNAQTLKLETEIKQLQSEYDECSDRYADACRFYQHQQVSFNPITFLFSSSTFKQLTRRMRYIGEYSSSLESLAVEIKEKQDTLKSKKAQVELAREEKLILQKEQQKNEAAVAAEEKSQRAIVNKLKSKRSALKKEIQSQQKKITELNKEIDRQIQLAIKEQQKETQTGGTLKVEEDIKLTGSFESNKGKLPIPITGSYLIVGNYGVQNVAGMKDVKINNLGIDIQGTEGSQARVIFNGVVTTVFQQGKGQIGVLVRHGKYISVYCNLSEIAVKKGDELKTGDIIGNIHKSDNGQRILHFQLHKETAKLNPMDWLRR
ncbi:MAG: peptidoglycan DD-metalloendopeptidase family protein [Bacteroidaceae bacterium]|nr:peptidoglycan DD-metalloendopeptidase family protein [Bacteroidaceae bacterium]